MMRVLCCWMGLVSAALGADAVLQGVVKQPMFDKADYEGDTSHLPIGVFDSGIGGLTVLEAILKLDAFHNESLQPGADGRPDFENERFLYLGDQANMPYGNYSAAGRTDFLRELILRDAGFLLGRRYHEGGVLKTDKPPVKAIVIACNTATAYGLEDIRAALAEWRLPVIVVGVVEAGARGVAEVLPKELGSAGVAVLATVGTCSSGAYPRAIQKAAGQAGRSPPVIVQQGSVGLAGAIEGDSAFLSNGATVESHLKQDIAALVETHRKEGGTVPIRSVVLGCTHFPLVAEEIVKTFAEVRQGPGLESLVAERVEIVDPAQLTAKELFRELARAKLRNKGTPAGGNGFFISVPNPQDQEAQLEPDGKRLKRDYQYARLPGNPARTDTLVVRMLPEQLPAPSLNLLKRHLPHVWKELDGGK